MIPVSVERPDPSFGWQNWLFELRRAWWAVPLIGLGLTILSTNPSEDSVEKILESFANNCLVAFCIGATTTALYSFVINRFDEQLSASKFGGLVHLVALTLGVGVGSEIALAILHLIYPQMDPSRARGVMWRVGGVIGAAVTLVSIAYERLRERARNVELRAEQDRRELLRAQLETLQARTNPHFLFNSLNTLAALVEEDPGRGVEAIEQLSQLMRYSLEGSKADRVPLREEVAALRDYLALEQLRFGDRLRTRLEVDERAESVPVPPFILQPLVENAIKHGISRRREGGEILVRVTHEDGEVRVAVQDDGPGVSDQPGTKTGEANLRERLRIVYGDRASFDSGPREAGGYGVELRLPTGAAEVGA